RFQSEGEQVRALDVVGRGAPGMKLHDADLEQAEQALEAVDPEADALAAGARLDAELVYGVGHGRQGALMEEGLAGDAAHQLEGAAGEVEERFLGDRLPVGGQLLS